MHEQPDESVWRPQLPILCRVYVYTAKTTQGVFAVLTQSGHGLVHALMSSSGISIVDFSSEFNAFEQKLSTEGSAVLYGNYLSASGNEPCPMHIQNFQDQLLSNWVQNYEQELAGIPDLNELFQNTSIDNFSFSCQDIGLATLFSLMNSGNTTSLRSTMIDQVQGVGISSLQQKKNWIIEWYFNNDPMGSIYLATLRNPALVASYQTSPANLYGTPFATGMENYFQKIKNHFGQSMFDQLLTEFAQQSNLYVDEIKVDEWHIYGSSRLGVYEANRTISKRVARDLNNDNQITNNEYVIETPEEVMYLYSNYQLERGAKRYELANHLGNVLSVISDKKTANFTGTTFMNFTAERISATDYSPFGAPLAGRTWNGGEYRFGYQGSELDNEVLAFGNLYSTFYRELDARIGRWLSIDPEAKIKPWESPYVSMGNKPILHNDQLGNTDDKPRANNKKAEEKEHKKKVETDQKNTKTSSPGNAENCVGPICGPKESEKRTETQSQQQPNSIEPPKGITLKSTIEGVLANPGIRMDLYSTYTSNPTPTPFVSVINAKTLEIESTTIKLAVGELSLGADGSATYGNGIVSLGENTSGNVIVDLSIPVTNKKTVGATYLISPTVYKNSLDSRMKDLGDSFSKNKPFFLFVPLPLLVLTY